MTFFRRALGRVTLACLLSQLATSVVVPAVVFAYSDSDLECTCSHGDHAMCPMHHRSSTRCGMRGAPDLAIALVPALFGFTGVMPAAIAPVPIVSSAPTFDRVTLSPIFRTAPPEGPPPRG
jgi:hypothetical protein